jgi:DNA-binding transcriptional MerR regulator
MKRRGNRRYYQHHEVLLIRRIRELLYEQGFTISGARNRLSDAVIPRDADSGPEIDEPDEVIDMAEALEDPAPPGEATVTAAPKSRLDPGEVRSELLAIRALLVL